MRGAMFQLLRACQRFRARPRRFGEDEAGELYVTSINNGRVFTIDAPVLPSIFPVNDLNADGKSDLLFQHSDGASPPGP